MPRRVPLEKLVNLQDNPENIRNVSILAHVDHGKTTLADSLISSNGIISSRSITDQIRYMDSREDEQLRGITMKTSSITLYHQKQSQNEDDQEFLINLIDSPGHIDFSSEVSTAVRLSDGCLVVVDVVEGVCPQTQAVLKQAWLEQQKPILVLNKIDRLIIEKKMTPLETYQRINQILEQVNAAVALLFSSDVMKENEQKYINNQNKLTPDKLTKHVKEQNLQFSIDADFVEIDDEGLYFTPESGNVVFASAIHGWGFTVEHFAEMYAKKKGWSKDVLCKVLYGDFYMNTKLKKFCSGAINRGKGSLRV